MAAVLLSAGGLVGLVLAAIGLYGAVSHAVAQRLRELGVRAALGATSRDLIALLLEDGVRVMAIGSVAGIALSFIPLRLTAWMFPGLPSVDLVSFIVMPALLLAVVLTACFIPARRAARMDPARVLRGE
jgi:ABC-type antimicrobial peptide transport system permease subunit